MLFNDDDLTYMFELCNEMGIELVDVDESSNDMPLVNGVPMEFPLTRENFFCFDDAFSNDTFKPRKISFDKNIYSMDNIILLAS